MNTPIKLIVPLELTKRDWIVSLVIMALIIAGLYYTDSQTLNRDKTMAILKSNNLAEIEIVYKTKVKPADRQKIKTSQDAADILHQVWNLDSIEHVETAIIILLNRNSDVLGWAKLSTGGVAGTIMDKKVIFQIALNANASGIILSHNHPSGNLQPSKQDIALTKEILTAGKLLDIKVLDHIILTEDSYTSMGDEGLI